MREIEDMKKLLDDPSANGMSPSDAVHEIVGLKAELAAKEAQVKRLRQLAEMVFRLHQGGEISNYGLLATAREALKETTLKADKPWSNERLAYIEALENQVKRLREVVAQQAFDAHRRGHLPMSDNWQECGYAACVEARAALKETE